MMSLEVQQTIPGTEIHPAFNSIDSKPFIILQYMIILYIRESLQCIIAHMHVQKLGRCPIHKKAAGKVTQDFCILPGRNGKMKLIYWLVFDCSVKCTCESIQHMRLPVKSNQIRLNIKKGCRAAIP